MARQEIKAVSADEARRFWEQQADARIFLHPDVLEPLCERVDWWLASWNGNPVCLWPICHAFDGSHRPPELSSYVGPLWHDAIARNKAHRWWTIASENQHALIRFLVDRYGSFVFELPPGSRDVRVFQWFGADNAESTTVDVECRHTAVLTPPAIAGNAGIIADFSRNRTRDIQSAEKRDFREWSEPDRHALYGLYESLLGEKEDGDKARRRENEVISLIGVAVNGFGRVIAYRDEDGNPASFTLLLNSRKTALQLLIASSDIARRDGLQAWVQLQAIIRSFQDGATVFDFVGGNSPIGAEEKHRYGAWPEMYFRISVVAR